MRGKVGLLVLWMLLVVVCLPGHSQDQDSTSPALGDIARQVRKDKNQASGQNQEADNSQQNLAPLAPIGPMDVAEASAVEAREIDGLKAATFKANILITDSRAAIEKWVLLPAREKARTANIRQVTPGTTIHVAFVVTDYNFPASERMLLTKDIQLMKSDGKVMDIQPTSAMIAPDPKSPNVIVVKPLMTFTFDSDDDPGTFTISVIIIDHVHSTYAKAVEHVDVVWKF